MSHSEPASEQNHHQNNFSFLRFVFAVLVIFSHSYPILYGDNTNEPFYVFSRGQVTGGRVAVAFFFILSGYLITQSWFNSYNSIDYLRKRILRIYPGFFVNSLFCLIIVAMLGSKDPSSALAQFKLSEFFVHQLFLYLPGVSTVFVTNPMPNSINGAAWTIRYEFACYIVILVLGIIGVLRFRKVAVGIYCVVYSLFLFQLIGVLKFPLPFESGRTFFLIGDIQHYPEFITLFMTGSLFYLFRDRIVYSKRMLYLALIILVATTISGYGFLLALPLAGAYVMFYLGFGNMLQFQNFGRKYDLTYGVYLYGYPIQQLLVYYLGASMALMVLFAMATILSIGFAALSWRFVEKPALSLKGKKRPIEIPKVVQT